ncbi:MAG: hypothetical protein EA342_13200 [Leptolyngbya sp. LCM1.Bin17]|nr:MAG: hypothetical protein EA342_13200 [Leptolyngbya sp. LCM1.Bin17]
MAITLTLSPELEQYLIQEANQHGLSVETVASELLTNSLSEVLALPPVIIHGHGYPTVSFLSGRVLALRRDRGLRRYNHPGPNLSARPGGPNDPRTGGSLVARASAGHHSSWALVGGLFGRLVAAASLVIDGALPRYRRALDHLEAAPGFGAVVEIPRSRSRYLGKPTLAGGPDRILPTG